MKKLALTALIASMMAGGAYAQSTTMPASTATEANTQIQYVTPTETDIAASKLMNANVMNGQDDTIGEIKDVIIRKNSIAGIVIGVGGFLGVGERYVVVDPSSVQMSNQDGKWKIVLNATKDSLMAAPEFKYEGHWAK